MEDTLWDLVRDERLSLAEDLADLDDHDWRTTSLCTEWTVHHVLAHLVMTPSGEPRPTSLVRALVRERGRLWPAGRDLAVDHAGAHTPGDLVASLAELAGSRRKPVFVLDENILVDLVVHGQDVAVPLGLDRPVPEAAARPVLDRVWAMGWPFHARRRLRDVRLVATGPGGRVVWSAGEGPEVRGPAGVVALLTTGRTRAALDLLEGPGVEQLRRRPVDATWALR